MSRTLLPRQYYSALFPVSMTTRAYPTDFPDRAPDLKDYAAQRYILIGKPSNPFPFLIACQAIIYYPLSFICYLLSEITQYTAFRVRRLRRTVSTAYCRGRYPHRPVNFSDNCYYGRIMSALHRQRNLVLCYIEK